MKRRQTFFNVVFLVIFVGLLLLSLGVIPFG